MESVLFILKTVFFGEFHTPTQQGIHHSCIDLFITLTQFTLLKLYIYGFSYAGIVQMFMNRHLHMIYCRIEDICMVLEYTEYFEYLWNNYFPLYVTNIIGLWPP